MTTSLVFAIFKTQLDIILIFFKKNVAKTFAICYYIKRSNEQGLLTNLILILCVHSSAG